MTGLAAAATRIGPPRFRRAALMILAGLAASAAAASPAAAVDRIFWKRYLERAPAILRLPGAKPKPIPPERATIAGAATPVLEAGAPSAPLAAALGQADAYLSARQTHAFLVWHDGRLVHERYWRGDAATLRPAGPIAKPVMALVVGRAIREGVVRSLDQPLSDHIAEWRGDARSRITWRHMLAMQSGLEWYHQTRSPWGRFQRLLLSGDYARHAVDLRAVAEPGRHYDYSAWTYDLVGIALQRASGRPYETLASDWLWRPIGADNAKIYVDRPGGTVHGNCCLWTTARDQVRLGAFLVQEVRRPERLPADFIAAMRQGGAEQPNYGLGVWLGSPYAARRTVAGPNPRFPTPVKSEVRQSEPFVADDVLIFEGVDDTKVWVVPSRALVLVRMGGRPSDWDEAVVPNLVMRALGHAAS